MADTAASPAAQPTYDEWFNAHRGEFDASLKDLMRMGKDPKGLPGQVNDLRNSYRRRYDEEMIGTGLSSFQEMAKEASGRLAGIAENPNKELAANYYEQMDAPIKSGFYESANQLSSYLARQGLGSSGMNLAGHGGLEVNRAALESQAQKQALNMSMEKERQGVLDAFSTRASALQPQLQKYGIDTSYAIAQMQMQQQMEALRRQQEAGGGLGSLVGNVLGTGAGAFLGGYGTTLGMAMGGGLGGGGYTGGGMGPGVPALEYLG